jgi:tetratricopeptide (TPR) repeat protein
MSRLTDTSKARRAYESRLEPIEHAIRRGQLDRAMRLIRRDLRQDPGHHWLLTQLAEVLRLQGKHVQALVPATRALADASWCPQSQFQCARVLDALGCHHAALVLYRRLIYASTRRLAYGNCGEGIYFARRLQARCLIAAALCYLETGAIRFAREDLASYVRLRHLGVDDEELESTAAHLRARLKRAADRIRTTRKRGLRSESATRTRAKP